MDGELSAEWMAEEAVVLLALALDLRRRRFLNIFLLIFLPFVMIEPEPDVSEESESLELELSDDELFMMSASTPGYDSSSMTSWGVLSYR